MLTYNTHLKKLILPEYGRTIQEMVDHSLTIDDREERNACVRAIVDTIKRLFPSNENQEDYIHKIYDHIAIMSDFKLDIDWPYEVVRREDLDTKPDVVERQSHEIRYKQYGYCLQAVIEDASRMEASPERDALALLLANHMKKMMLTIDPEGTPDAYIFNDLRVMSHGVLNLDPNTVCLHQFVAAPTPAGKKKKKKKKIVS